MGWTPKILNGQCVNGCAEISPRDRKLQAAAVKTGVSVEYLWDHDGEMPIVAFDDSFNRYIDERIEFNRKLRKKGVCLWPWVIFAELPKSVKKSDVYDWNQGPIPDCTATAASGAAAFGKLIDIALGAPIEYDAFNALYLHYGITKGAIHQGLTTFEVAEWMNKNGSFPTAEVGKDNRTSPRDYSSKVMAAKKNRSAICYITSPTVETFFRLAEAGIPFMFGSAQFYAGDALDANGVGVGNRITSGAHAEACSGAYLKVNGTEYIHIQNSHGDGYSKDRTGKPKSGYWVTRKECALFCRTAANYGHPYISFPRGARSKRLSLANGMSLKFPKNA